MSRNYISKNTVDKIISARSVVFFTGAGISAESGIPIFRGKDGIWNKLKPDELANFNSFLKNPDLVWEWYNHRKKVIHESEPNKGHLTIAEFENILPEVIVVTQNIDNLHKRAGSSNVYELHGNIERNYCIKCNKFYNGEIELKDSAPRCEFVRTLFGLVSIYRRNNLLLPKKRRKIVMCFLLSVLLQLFIRRLH